MIGAAMVVLKLILLTFWIVIYRLDCYSVIHCERKKSAVGARWIFSSLKCARDVF